MYKLARLSMGRVKSLSLVCYDGTIQGSKTISSDAGLISVHHLHRNDAYNLPDDFHSEYNSGIYVLVGQQNRDQLSVYIGEAGNVIKRLDQHTGREWWTSVYIFNKTGGEINRAMREFLENKMINDKNIQRFVIENVKKKSNVRLNQADKINANTLYSEIVDGCRNLGFSLFEPLVIGTKNVSSEHYPIFTLRGKKHVAYLQVRGDDYVLLPGTILSNLSPKLDYPSVEALRQSYNNGDEIKQEIVFKSPSPAAAFAAGVNLSGRYEWWIKKSGKSLGEWQDGA